MMPVNSITGANANMIAGGAGVNIQADSISRNIQNQIAAAQKKLQELSSDDDMKLEEKMKKKQEIQQEINNLNQQLRQHQIELRKQQQFKNASTNDSMPNSYKKQDIEKLGSKGS